MKRKTVNAHLLDDVYDASLCYLMVDRLFVPTETLALQTLKLALQILKPANVVVCRQQPQQQPQQQQPQQHQPRA